MLCVKVEITKYVDASFPGFVECRLTDAWGGEWLFVEKLPVVSLADLDETSCYPQAGMIACQVIDRRHDSTGREIVTINTYAPWHIESTSGETQFDVLLDQLTDFDWSGSSGQ